MEWLKVSTRGGLGVVDDQTRQAFQEFHLENMNSRNEGSLRHENIDGAFKDVV
jgi:hypothetical protein